MAFDLEQVIFLPKSNRSEIFYKRRLSNYNFTLYNLESKEAWAFVWHECIAGRGANEIASCIQQYLQHLEEDHRIQTIDMYCDGCSGQNKNSILPTMMMSVIEHSSHFQRIRLNIMVPHHSQNENDSLHSCVERALKRSGDINVPAQLTPVIRCSRKKALNVVEVTTGMVLDWQKMSKELGVLRVRRSERGEGIKWPDMCQIEVRKENPRKLFFKTSL